MPAMGIGSPAEAPRLVSEISSSCEARLASS